MRQPPDLVPELVRFVLDHALIWPVTLRATSPAARRVSPAHLLCKLHVVVHQNPVLIARVVPRVWQEDSAAPHLRTDARRHVCGDMSPPLAPNTAFSRTRSVFMPASTALRTRRVCASALSRASSSSIGI